MNAIFDRHEHLYFSTRILVRILQLILGVKNIMKYVFLMTQAL